MKVNIKDLEITLKYSFRALIVYEEIMGETLTVPQSLKEILVLFYSIVLANSETKDITYDDFIDWLDDNPEKSVEFTNWLKDVLEALNKVTEKHAKEVEGKTPKKARSTRSKTV